MNTEIYKALKSINFEEDLSISAAVSIGDNRRLVKDDIEAFEDRISDKLDKISDKQVEQDKSLAILKVILAIGVAAIVIPLLKEIMV